MQVVLRHDVDSLGLRGEVVNVARGYARNYLLPRGLAQRATPGLVAELARRETRLARHQARDADEARAVAARLEASEIRFEVKAGPTGSLFGSVTATTVADRLWETQKIRIDRRKLDLAPIKRVGRYTAPVELFAGVVAELRLAIVPEGGELPPDEPPDAPAGDSSGEAGAEAVSETPAHGSDASPLDDRGDVDTDDGGPGFEADTGDFAAS